MRNSEKVLNGLSKHSPQLDYRYERLYKNLFNEEMFYTAYQRIYAKEGNMTEGSDGKTIDGMSLNRISDLIDLLRTESYQPQPARRVYIPKKNGKMRPLGIPSFDDKLVQEVVRMMLEAIYEGQFLDCSHGFRPYRSCHTALVKIQKTFTGAKWFVEGDIKGFFDEINHQILIGILKERIADDRFLRLIWKFLKAGYVEDWTFHNSYSGTPQGGIVSPILANIYLDRLDRYMVKYAKNFDRGTKRKPHATRSTFEVNKARLLRKLRKVEDENERDELVKQIKAIDKERLTIPSCDEMDDGYKRIKYVRYADDFLIGIIGSKEDSKRIKEDIRIFLETELKLELSEEKTVITHTEKPAKFLGYEILVRRSNAAKRDKLNRLVRFLNGTLQLSISMETIKKKLLDFGILEVKMTPKGKEWWKPREHTKMLNSDDLEILKMYNYTLRGFYNYYSVANNSAILNSYGYIMEYSMYRTFACKYRSSVRKILRQYEKNGVFTVSYTNKKGDVRNQSFYKGGYKRKLPSADVNLDNSKPVYYSGRTSLIDRLKAQKCEICGATETLDMHHVRKLKDLDGKGFADKMMMARRRKTIALCRSCHLKTHAGSIDRSFNGEPDTLRGVRPVRGRAFENLPSKNGKASGA
ncbi:reverse transcriptase domain-containing protein [Dyadobacter subterraneus]|uniref:RNA-directed DNA polymerase n=1 Tax=Dyadobacter subterraneus TaxID=2773304 RepID=A0ABR9WAA8_9BACT|nr:reverse transcriptase domain-containing protein [Dyadobacter subterraneus]MBE9462069.1 group II intron reverse transcriptase/maturase [Dyadobacter subterraneus]